MLLARTIFRLSHTFSSINQLMPYHRGEDYKSAAVVRTAFGPTILLKTHEPDRPSIPISEDAGVYIYRHPLDVFLSSINYCYITKDESAFIDGRCKSVDDIFRDGEIGYYFDRYLDFGGLPTFGPFAGSWVESLTNWLGHASACPSRFVAVRYEDLIHHCPAVLQRILTVLGIEPDPADIARALSEINAEVDQSVKVDIENGGGRGFFWKRGEYYFNQYLTSEQIGRFEERHRDMLELIGYGIALESSRIRS